MKKQFKRLSINRSTLTNLQKTIVTGGGDSQYCTLQAACTSQYSVMFRGGTCDCNTRPGCSVESWCHYCDTNNNCLPGDCSYIC
jgi:hypothetical protein